MKRPCIAAFLAGSLLALAAHAQDATKPAPATDKAAATQDPAAKPRGPGETPDPQILESIVACLANGLSKDWKKTWFVIKEIDRNEAEGARQFEGDFFFATSLKDSKGKRLQTCGAEQIIQGVSDLNDYLTRDQQHWTSATFSFWRDGKYDVKYDFTPFKPKPAAPTPAATPAAKPATKKTQGPAAQ
jgi:hypothetical protein